jgi:hypothetical protein
MRLKIKHGMCHDFNFALATKAKAWKGAGPKFNLEVTFALPRSEGMNSHTPKWTPTLGVGIFKKVF